MADSAPAIAIIYTAKVWPNISSKLNELINIKNVIANNIISIEISINIIFFLFKTKPKTPIKKSTKDKFIVYFYYLIIIIYNCSAKIFTGFIFKLTLLQKVICLYTIIYICFK